MPVNTEEEDGQEFRDAWMEQPSDMSDHLLMESRGSTIQLLDDESLDEYENAEQGETSRYCYNGVGLLSVVPLSSSPIIHGNDEENPALSPSDHPNATSSNDDNNAVVSSSFEDDKTTATDFDDDDGTVTVRNGCRNSQQQLVSTGGRIQQRTIRSNQTRGGRSTNKNGGGVRSVPLVGTSSSLGGLRSCRPDGHHNRVVHHGDSRFIERARKGNAVLIKNGELPFRKKGECDASSLDAFFGALFCLALVLTLVLSFGGITKADDDQDMEPMTPSTTTILPSDGNSSGIDSYPPRGFHTGVFKPMSALVVPHTDEHLPTSVRPQVSFGHLVDLDGNGDRFVAAMRGPKDSDGQYHGAYQVFRWAVAVHDWIWERTLYHTSSSVPSAYSGSSYMSSSSGAVKKRFQDIQVVSMNGNGERIAFTQGGETFIYLGSSGHDIERFGPANSNVNRVNWHAISVALSHWGDTLAILLSSENDNQPSVLEIFHETHSTDGTASWELVSQATLATSATGGFLFFGYESGIDLLAVGTFQESSDGNILSETVDVYSSINGITGTWFPLGNPQLVANSYLPAHAQPLGGSTFSLSVDGGALAIGSRNGRRNRVVILRLDSTGTGKWSAYGTNNVLGGESEDANFGASIHFDHTGKRLFVGAPGPFRTKENTYSMSRTLGKVFVYQFDASSDTWILLTEPIVHPETEGKRDQTYQFGSAFAIDQSGSRVIVGLPQEQPPGPTHRAGANRPLGAVASFHLVE